MFWVWPKNHSVQQLPTCITQATTFFILRFDQFDFQSLTIYIHLLMVYPIYIYLWLNISSFARYHAYPSPWQVFMQVGLVNRRIRMDVVPSVTQVPSILQYIYMYTCIVHIHSIYIMIYNHIIYIFIIYIYCYS